MKKIWKILIVSCLVIGAGGLVGCESPLEEATLEDLGVFQNSSIDSYDLMKNIGNWKFQETKESDKRKVLLTVTEDIDYLFWTRSNGEVIYSDSKCKMGDLFYSREKVSFTKRTEPYVFDFSELEAGTYILDIHYKDTKKNSDSDFRGKVNITGETSVIDIKDGQKGGEACSKQARYRIYNDSKVILNNIYHKKRDGNTMSNFIYVFYDSNKSWCDYTYKTIFTYNDLSIKPNDSVVVLLPLQKEGVKEGGFLLKPVLNDGKVVFFGTTVQPAYKKGFGHPQFGSINNDFKPLGDGKFYSNWDSRKKIE